jgi:hypothetical protein
VVSCGRPEEERGRPCSPDQGIAPVSTRPEDAIVSLADRDYWREVPEYRRLMGREPDARPSVAPRHSGASSAGGFWTRPVRPSTAIIAALLGVGMILLPHLNIAGQHWHIYLLP